MVQLVLQFTQVKEEALGFQDTAPVPYWSVSSMLKISTVLGVTQTLIAVTPVRLVASPKKVAILT